MLNQNWNGQANFVAYDDVEKLENYPTAEILLAYRRERLSFYAKHLEFLQSLFKPNHKLNVIEVGSGSSALLYQLERKGILIEATGVELSASRYRFAEQWKKDEGYHKVININSDFTKVEFGINQTDLFLAIDNTFAYLYPESPEHPQILLQKAKQALNSGGKLILDMTYYSQPLLNEMTVPNGRTFWRELPETNPFKYSLYRQIYRKDHNIIKAESIYITRTNTESKKIEYSYRYTKEILAELLTSVGFTIDGWYDGFSDKAFDENNSTRLLVVATKP